MKSISLIIFCSLFIFPCSLAFAQQAVIQEMTGTVELKQANAAEWETAVQGQNIAVDTIVSTGFKSTALLKLGDSLITVRPLTRLSVTELSSRLGTEAINVSLQSGRVQVDAKAPAGARASFRVQSPIATASTRGTIFEIGVYELRVMEGAIEYTGASGAAVVIDAGGRSYINEKTGRAALPEETLFASLDPELPLAADIFYSFEGAPLQPKSSLELSAIADY